MQKPPSGVPLSYHNQPGRTRTRADATGTETTAQRRTGGRSWTLPENRGIVPRMLDMHEVTGSNPVVPTTQNLVRTPVSGIEVKTSISCFLGPVLRRSYFAG